MKLKLREKIIKKIEFPIDFFCNKDISCKIIEYKGFKYIVGFYLDSALDEEHFFVQYFTQPTFIPFSTYVFTLGDRVGSYWNSKEIEELETKILSIDIPNNIHELLVYWQTKFKKFNDNYKYQSLGFTYFLMSDYDKCIKELEKISFDNLDNQPHWKQEELLRIKEILFLLRKREYEKSLDLLLKWQDFTIKALKID